MIELFQDRFPVEYPMPCAVCRACHKLLTGECRMEHRHLADDHSMRIVTDTESFDSVKAMQDYILEKLW